MPSGLDRHYKHGRTRLRKLLLLTTALGILWLAVPAQAEVTAGCSGTVAGSSIAGRSSTDGADAIPVQEHTAVAVSGRSPSPLTHLRISLEYGGLGWSVYNKPQSGDSWTNSVDIDQYAKYGVGLYKLVAESSGGSPCVGAVLINVAGNPLSTLAGKGALATTAAGAIGLVASSAASAKPGPRSELAKAFEEADRLEGYLEENEKAQDRAEEKFLSAETDAERKRWQLERANLEDEHASLEDELTDMTSATSVPRLIRPCAWMVIPALILTGAAMATGSEGSQPRAGRPTPKVGWRPKISVVGVGSGLLMGLGSVILVGQYAILYPSGSVAIAFLALGVALGIILPSLARKRAAKKLSKRLVAKR